MVTTGQLKDQYFISKEKTYYLQENEATLQVAMIAITLQLNRNFTHFQNYACNLALKSEVFVKNAQILKCARQ